MNTYIKSLITSLGLMLLAATPASGNGWTQPSITSTLNNAVITNNITTTSITGMNTQGNSAIIEKAGADNVWIMGNNTLTTGTAVAKTNSVAVANVTPSCNSCAPTVRGGGFPSPSSTTLATNFATVNVTTVTQADSGDNNQGSGVSVTKARVDGIAIGGNNTLTTGTAIAKTNSIVVVNAQWNGGM